MLVFFKMNICVTNDHKHEFHCTRCGHYIQIQFYIRIAGNFILVCHNCSQDEDFKVPRLSHEEYLLWRQIDPARQNN